MFSGLGWQPFIFLPFSFLRSLGERFLSSLLSMKIMKTQKKRADSLVYKVLSENWSLLDFFALFCCQSLLLFMDLNSIAGVWSLFHAVIYRNLLPCPFTPQLFDSSHSLDSAPPCVWGENVKWVACYLPFFFSLLLLLLLSWTLFSRYWKTWWKILYHIWSTVIRNLEFGKAILCIIISWILAF